MCGIAGVIDFESRPVNRSLLERWQASLSHRGPDDHGIWVGELGRATVGLAHTRLAIFDTTEAGHQPMFDEAGEIGVVYNGAVYNFAELRRELTAGGCTFRSASDTEVILHAYARWGPGCFERFNGMWAMAVVDRRNARGLLARDRYGIKPLCYAIRDGRLHFASEMSALAQVPGLCDEIDADGLTCYLRLGHVPHPGTIFQGVHRLPPGTLLRFDDKRVAQPEPYYRLPAEPTALGYADACRALRERIGRAVTDRLIADVPLGAFLSGGLDSSIIVSHMAERGGQLLKTFSMGYAEQPRYDETRFARLVADRFATDHHELKLTFAEVIDELPAVLDNLGEPFGDASLIPTTILSRHTRSAVTVALSGDGGDELFAGYWRYLGHDFYERYCRLPAMLRRGIIEPIVRRLPAGKDTALANRVRQMRKMLRASGDDPMECHLAWSQILAPEAAERLFASSADVDLADVFDRAQADRFEPAAHTDPLNDILRTDLLVNLPGDMLHKVDLAAMRYALEVRIPFLDPAVVHLAISLPSGFKLVGKHGKCILVDAYRDVLPPEVLSRPKMGFELPIGEFLRNELRELFHDVVTQEAVTSFECLSWPGVQRLYADHCRRRAEHADLLYALLVLCWWHRRARSIPE